ncbi:ABC-2 type transporter [Gleimia coleocanis DSM 15436]|uniref:ABC-2 type transporter n=1 Tax=Gleimia coleocanis DSM 15436 TaxID=525245 RepID=C0W089_9ACTO|nr:ABC transporter permease [Gleimia coleocanis]EEH63948.1 ABC-2 type transporter [Gleimia coleocanis DSM 15436]
MKTLAEIKKIPTSNGFKGFGKNALVAFQKVAAHPLNLIFAVGLPVMMYLIFGVGKEYSSIELPHANVSAQIMVNMAFYGVAVAGSSVAAGITLERANGVSRLFSLTPMSPLAFLLTRVVASLTIITLAILTTFTVGAYTDAKMEPLVWGITGVLLLASALLATLMGLAFGFLLRSDAAYAGVSGLTVISAFLGGIFIPLEQMASFVQDLAPFSPLYGGIRLVSYPIYGEGFEWGWVTNLLVWMLIFALLAWMGNKRDTGR